jgi:DNA-binding NtrC family response regulator
MDKTITPTPHRILIVDDEQGIINAVRRELSTPPLGRYRYEVETFTNPLEALERARTQEFEVVVSDYRMPEMDGLTFLKTFGGLPHQQDCVPIVLSGQTEFDALIRMINETHIYRFIPKPWSSYFLKSSLSQAIDFRQASIENRTLASSLRQSGIDLPHGTLNPIDQILVVDDELNVANSIARCLSQRSTLDDMFRLLREEGPEGRIAELNPASISVQISTSSSHALKMTDAIDFSCVIADYRMPGIDGAQFLAQLADKRPDCACILMSGAPDMEGVVIALDLARIQFFIAKPWDDFVLRAAVAQSLARRRLLLENRELVRLCKARNIPTDNQTDAPC